MKNAMATSLFSRVGAIVLDDHRGNYCDDQICFSCLPCMAFFLQLVCCRQRALMEEKKYIFCEKDIKENIN